jgi:hypothetical protein
MKQYLKQREHSAEIMETGDYFKNGASPKSHTSRENFNNQVR